MFYLVNRGLVQTQVASLQMSLPRRLHHVYSRVPFLREAGCRIPSATESFPYTHKPSTSCETLFIPYPHPKSYLVRLGRFPGQCRNNSATNIRLTALLLPSRTAVKEIPTLKLAYFGCRLTALLPIDRQPPRTSSH